MIVYFQNLRGLLMMNLNTSLNTGNELHFDLFIKKKKKIKLKTVKNSNDKACWHEALNTYDHVHAFSVHLSL